MADHNGGDRHDRLYLGTRRSAVTWVKLDDKRAMNRKLRRAGFAARGLDEAAICLSAHAETDGFIDLDHLEDLGAMHGCSDVLALAEKLVEVGRWRKDGRRNGWWILNYLEFNPSRAELEDKRRRDRERKRTPAGFHADSNGNPNGVHADSANPSRPVPARPDMEVDHLCEVLSSLVADHRGTRPKITKAWRSDMDKLVRLGPAGIEKPTDWTPDRIEKGIRRVFTELTTRGPNGFCWADQIRSPGALREKWDQLRVALRAASAGRSDRGWVNHEGQMVEQ